MEPETVLTERMVLGVKLLGALKDVILPSFCEGVKNCKNCVLHRDDIPGYDCRWMRLVRDIEELQMEVTVEDG